MMRRWKVHAMCHLPVNIGLHLTLHPPLLPLPACVRVCCSRQHDAGDVRPAASQPLFQPCCVRHQPVRVQWWRLQRAVIRQPSHDCRSTHCPPTCFAATVPASHAPPRAAATTAACTSFTAAPWARRARRPARHACGCGPGRCGHARFYSTPSSRPLEL